MKRGLSELFLSLDGDTNFFCEDLFGDVQMTGQNQYSKTDTEIIYGLYSQTDMDLASLCEPARRLYDCSKKAFYSLVHAWMSEFPIEAEIIRFGKKVIGLCRQAAEKAATDRGDPDTRIVLQADFKVLREIERLRGILRFKPDSEGVYTAFCSPDHFVLPALKDHFSRRFGQTSWAIIDEKRCICVSDGLVKSLSGSDEWEDLWRNYHKTINNDSRNNPTLQRQFMPRRYRKYLTEL